MLTQEISGEPYPPYESPSEMTYHEFRAPEQQPSAAVPEQHIVVPHEDVGDDFGATDEDVPDVTQPSPALMAGSTVMAQAIETAEPVATEVSDLPEPQLEIQPPAPEPVDIPQPPAEQITERHNSVIESAVVEWPAIKPEAAVSNEETPEPTETPHTSTPTESTSEPEPPVERAGGSPPIDIPPETPPPAAGEPEEPEEPNRPQEAEESDVLDESQEPKQFEGPELPPENEQPEPQTESRPTRKLSPLATKRALAERRSEEKVAEMIASEKEGHPWPKTDSNPEDMDKSFKHTIPRDKGTLRMFVEKSMKDIPDKTAIEVGGIGSRLFGEFTEGTFEKTIGVNLTDTRKKEFGGEQIIADDDARGHKVIEGNLMSDEVHAKVDEALGGQKAGIIIERMTAGLTTLPRDPFIMAQEAARWYDKLADATPNANGGTIFAEVPLALTDYVYEWKKMIDRDYPGSLEVETDYLIHTAVVRITKRAGAPEKLPLLPARQILRPERYTNTDTDSYNS